MAGEALAMRLCKVTPPNRYHFLVELGYANHGKVVGISPSQRRRAVQVTLNIQDKGQEGRP